ncbi:MAG: hypothetical protein CMQ54_00480 [Gammaproteobacteria bacterium]|nr:hypothetical protein [Gammaproteobacteria bacterium]
MNRVHLKNILFSTLMMTALPAVAFFKVVNTDFEENFAGATTYPTKSLLMKFNYKTQDLNIGSYAGTWKNRKTSSSFMGFGKKKTTTEITLENDAYGTWTIFCSGIKKEITNAFGMTYERQGAIDYQCIMQSGDQTAVLVVLPFKKPKFSMGPPVENRKVIISLPDGRELQGKSLHRAVGKKREYPKPLGYKISDGKNALGAIGMFEKEQVILVAPNVANTPDEHLLFMSGLSLAFFRKNDTQS